MIHVALGLFSNYAHYHQTRFLRGKVIPLWQQLQGDYYFRLFSRNFSPKKLFFLKIFRVFEKNLKKSKKWDFKKKSFFGRKISQKATESSFYREKFINGLFRQELPKVFVYPKIKFFSQPEPTKKNNQKLGLGLWYM